jgi:TPP-dependent pyruvate/acetoin dehydrogenase alpha subunit
MTRKYSPDIATQVDTYRRMILILQNDEATRKVIRPGRLVSPCHSPKGQQAIPAAVSVNLRAVPFSKPLETAFLTAAAQVVAAARQLARA